jgi:cephalosporin hydroxylase
LLPTELSVRGTILTDQALTARQHLMFPGGISVTDAIRPVTLEDTFEVESQAYARAVYLETGLHHRTRWLGEPVDLAPADLLNIQEILHLQRPDAVVVVDEGQGLASFLATTCAAMPLEGVQILHVRRDQARPVPGVEAVTGGPGDAAVLDWVRRRLTGSGSVLVLYEPEPDDHMPIDNLAAWAELVSVGGWLVFLRTLVGQPWLGYSRNWRSAAARELVARGAFRIETEWQDQVITLCPDGYLRRLPNA